MIRILSVFGTRPEAIKMAPVVNELRRRPDLFTSRICVTGQHREMLDQVLDLFAIAPDDDLNIMRHGQSLGDVTTAVLRGLDPILVAERPDWVLVQGDTTTSMAAGLAAFNRKIRIGHVEAGLRTYDKTRPFPEEMNRRITGVLADLHFAPTEWAAANLRQEGVSDERIVVTGNTVIDALRQVADTPFDPSSTPLATLPIGCKRIIAVTAHRRENFGHGIRQVCGALRDLAARYDDVQIVWPVHPNPHVHGPVHDVLGDVANVTLLPPLDYRSLVWLLKQSHFVITDSGGLQEEAPDLGKPVLVLRDSTERPEGVAAGTVRLVGTDRRELVRWASLLLDNAAAYGQMAHAVNPYGDGHAARRIAEALCDHHDLLY